MDTLAKGSVLTKQGSALTKQGSALTKQGSALKPASALAPTKQVSLVEDHGEQGTKPFMAADDDGAAAALAVKREASIQKLEAERDAREAERAVAPTRQLTMPTVTEEELLAELNRARTQPKASADTIAERLKHFRGNDYYPPARGGKTAVPTKEGTVTVREAMRVLQALTPLPALVLEEGRGLSLAAEDHLTDRGTTGHIGHEGADGSHHNDRQARYGAPSGKTGECLWFGRADASARQMVEDLLVDDGVPSRGHRLCVLDPVSTRRLD